MFLPLPQKLIMVPSQNISWMSDLSMNSDPSACHAQYVFIYLFFMIFYLSSYDIWKFPHLIFLPESDFFLTRSHCFMITPFLVVYLMSYFNNNCLDLGGSHTKNQQKKNWSWHIEKAFHFRGLRVFYILIPKHSLILFSWRRKKIESIRMSRYAEWVKTDQELGVRRALLVMKQHYINLNSNTINVQRHCFYLWIKLNKIHKNRTFKII